MQRAGMVERIERPAAADLLRDFVRPGRPVVIRGVADTWPASSRWSADLLKAKYPDLKVTVEVSEHGPTTSDPETCLRGVKRAKMDLASYIDAALGPTAPGKTYYLAQFPIFERAPELLEDIGPLEAYMDIPRVYPAWLRAKLQMAAGLWFGPAGSLSTLHFDVAQNFLAQIRGRKRVVLFSPDQSPLLYYPYFETRLLHFSPVDIEQPDYGRFPLFQRAEPVEVTLDAGEILHIPSGWWHFVRSLEPSLSLNFWWIRPALLVARRHFLIRQIAALLKSRLARAGVLPKAPGPPSS